MPQVNFTIDDRSPLIQYTPKGPNGWIIGSRTLDPLADRYSNNGTFMLCTAAGSSATFTFNGTGIWIFGAKRSNHGLYEVNLDNSVSSFNGFSNDGLFQTPLFSANKLFSGLHTVTITNRQVNATSFPFLDIDFITWTAEVDKIALSNQTIPHTNSSVFQYEPGSAWNQPVSSGFSSTTAHATTTPNATATLNFTGSAISIFGAVGPSVGSYSIELDGRPAQNYNATLEEYVPQTLLYFASDLGPGMHSIKMTNLPTQSGQGMFLDYAVVAEGELGPPDGDTNGSGSSGLGRGAIAGIAIGIVAVLAALTLAGFFWWKRRSGKGSRVRANLVIEDGRDLPPESLVYTPYTMGSATESQLLTGRRLSDGASTSVPPIPSMSQTSGAGISRILNDATEGSSSSSQALSTSFMSAGGSRIMYVANSAQGDPQSQRSEGYPMDSKRSMNILSPPATQTQYTPVVDQDREQDYEPPPSYDHIR